LVSDIVQEISYRVITLHFNGHFPGGPGLTSTRVMKVVVTTRAIRCAELQSKHHHQQTNTQLFLQAGCLSCRPTNSEALKGYS